MTTLTDLWSHDASTVACLYHRLMTSLLAHLETQGLKVPSAEKQQYSTTQHNYYGDTHITITNGNGDPNRGGGDEEGAWKSEMTAIQTTLDQLHARMASLEDLTTTLSSQHTSLVDSSLQSIKGMVESIQKAEIATPQPVVPAENGGCPKHHSRI
jgi:hypothetical protein